MGGSSAGNFVPLAIFIVSDNASHPTNVEILFVMRSRFRREFDSILAFSTSS